MSDLTNEIAYVERKGLSFRIRRFLGRIAPLNILGYVVNGGSDMRVPNDFKCVKAFHPFDEGREYTMSFMNDAFELILSTFEWERGPNKEFVGKGTSHNIYIFPAPVIRQFAIWYLLQWAWGEWFGLRRKLFYFWLTKHINTWRSKPDEVKR